LPKRSRGVLWFAFVGLVITAVTACGAGDAAQPTATPIALSPEEILRLTSARLAETQTAHFKLTVNGVTYVDEAKTIKLLGAEGDLQRPDRVHTTFKAEVRGGVTITIELITVGGESWSTDLISGKWGPAPDEFGYNPSILFDNQHGIGPVMNKVIEPTLLPDGELDGREVYRITGKGAGDVIRPITMSTMVGDPVGIDLWIDKATYDLLRVMLTEPATPEKPEGAIWILDLSRHDEDVTIEPPI
jgi:hypothetical protein